MSARNVRKVYGDTGLPPPDDNSDDDYQPLYAKNIKYTYLGLDLGSDSDDKHESTPESAEEVQPEPGPSKKNNKKKKKKQRKAKQAAQANDDVEDEIDRSIKEINELLGAPPPIPSSSTEDKPKDCPVPEILIVQQRHLNVANELKKLFGDDEPEERRNKRVNRQAQLRIQMKSRIVPTIENFGEFYKIGLSMSVTQREDGCNYFTFDHSKEYRRIQEKLLHAISVGLLPSLEEAQTSMHVEGMLQSADLLFHMEEYSAANTLIEKAIAYMQYVAHPSFQLADPRTRLRYLYVENRPFHIAILKYLHLLTNRACHRTALELAKLLLNLDPTDPLAVLLIIDTLALRAREHQWLIDAVDHWAKERDAGFLFTIQYSYAMAHFHVATKSKGDITKADNLLQSAIMRFPTVVPKIIECANAKLSDKLRAHPLFKESGEDNSRSSKNLADLVFLYAKFTWSKWREPAVFEWLQRNANEIADKYDNDPAVKESVKTLTNVRLNLFRSWPDEVIRHLCVIKSMSKLLVDGAVPEVAFRLSIDPVPPSFGINRYNYRLGQAAEPGEPAGVQAGLWQLLTTIYPQYAVDGVPPPNME